MIHLHSTTKTVPAYKKTQLYRTPKLVLFPLNRCILGSPSAFYCLMSSSWCRVGSRCRLTLNHHQIELIQETPAGRMGNSQDISLNRDKRKDHLDTCTMSSASMFWTESHWSFLDASILKISIQSGAIFSQLVWSRHLLPPHSVTLVSDSPLPSTYSQTRLSRFSSRILFWFFFSRAPLNIALFSCSSTTLIKMKAKVEVGSTQLNMDQKPCVMNNPHLGFFFSFSVSSMINVNFKSILQVKLQPLEFSLFDHWALSPPNHHHKMSYYVIFQILRNALPSPLRHNSK